MSFRYLLHVTFQSLTPEIYNAVLLLCFGPFLLVAQYILSIDSKGTKNAYFDSILAYHVLTLCCFLNHEYHIYLGPGFLQRLP